MNRESQKILFEEKQHLGYNKFSIFRRSLLAIFCFIAYYFSENSEISSGIKLPDIPIQGQTGDIFFIMGILILVISGLLIFVLHMHTKITANNSLVIDGLWTARKVKIDLSSIRSVKKVKYSKYMMNRPVYNLHRKGKIRFYTRGNEAVELTDKEGLRYVIGSQKSSELNRVLSECIKNQ